MGQESASVSCLGSQPESREGLDEEDEQEEEFLRSMASWPSPQATQDASKHAVPATQDVSKHDVSSCNKPGNPNLPLRCMYMDGAYTWMVLAKVDLTPTQFTGKTCFKAGQNMLQGTCKTCFKAATMHPSHPRNN